MIREALRGIALACALVAAVGVFAEVTFYEREDFRGRSFTVTAPVGNFTQYGFNDRASSALVRHVNYLVCEHAEFQGQCVTLVPGDYRSLRAMGLNNRISSARPARARPMPRAVLFEQPNLRGRSFAVEGDQAFRNLAGSGFGNVVSSVRVERGTWMFCAGTDYTGACRTFEPGDYFHLPRELNNRISSGRLTSHGDDEERRRPRRGQGND